MKFLHALIFFFLTQVFLIDGITAQKVIINEISQGDGNDEYVEFLVLGDPNCSSNNCQDLRGIIFDDNNGSFATGGGTGIAPGAMRFSNDAFWSCIPYGTLINVFNTSSLNPSIGSIDVSLSDSNCTLIIPDTSSLFDHLATVPNYLDSSYSSGTWINGGNWTTVTMNNTNDAFQLRSPNADTIYHSIGWGNNLGAQVYYSGPMSDMVFYLSNDSFTDSASWVAGSIDSIPNPESPGMPNQIDNELWIMEMNNNCEPYTNLNVNISSQNISCSGDCDGQIEIDVLEGIPPYTYTWSNGVLGDTLIDNLCEGNYAYTITDSENCVDSGTITLSEPTPLSFSIVTTNPSCKDSCNGFASFDVNGGVPPYSFNWNNSFTGFENSSLCAGAYIVTITDDNNCTVTNSFALDDPNVQINYNYDSLSSLPSIIDFEASNNFNASYTWYLNNEVISTDAEWNYEFEELGTYIIVVEVDNNQGCKFVSTFSLKWEELSIDIPNVFSPNNDQYNEVFDIDANALPTYSMYIYNRWGKKVFECLEQKNCGWDGTGAKGGTYYYIVDLLDDESLKLTKQYKGEITLLR